MLGTDRIHMTVSAATVTVPEVVLETATAASASGTASAPINPGSPTMEEPALAAIRVPTGMLGRMRATVAIGYHSEESL
jgi:hypothetical protein